MCHCSFSGWMHCLDDGCWLWSCGDSSTVMQCWSHCEWQEQTCESVFCFSLTLGILYFLLFICLEVSVNVRKCCWLFLYFLFCRECLHWWLHARRVTYPLQCCWLPLEQRYIFNHCHTHQCFNTCDVMWLTGWWGSSRIIEKEWRQELVAWCYGWLQQQLHLEITSHHYSLNLCMHTCSFLLWLKQVVMNLILREYHSTGLN